MAATDSKTLAWINYCCREGFYRQLQTVCLDSLKKYGNDYVLVFWKAYGMLMEDNITEAIYELQSIKDKPDVIICSLMALIVANKRAKNVDKAVVQQLEAKLKAERTQCSETALFFGSMFLFHNSRADKAREYIDRMLKMNSSSVQGLILKGWIDMRSSKDQYVKKSIKYFDEVLSGSVKEIDALLGKIEYLKIKNNFTEALELVNQLIVIYPDFYPGLVEKMKIQLALQDWEQVLETSERVFILDSQNIEALHLVILELVSQKSNYNEAIEKITRLIQVLDRREPKNPFLYASFGKTYARMCGRNKNVLNQSLTLIERARSLSPRNADFFNETGYQLMLQNNIKESLKAYQHAMKIDESSVAALTGIIQCQILENELSEAEQQLEFFKEIQSSIGKTPEILYLSALMAMKKGKSSEGVLQTLQETIEAHFSVLMGLTLSTKYFELLNPDFLLQIVDMLMLYAPSEPSGKSQMNNPILKKCSLILDPIVKTVPGLIQALYSLANVKYIAGDTDYAKVMLQQCLERDSTFVNAHILMAQIYLQCNNYSACEASLENGLSFNFEVKNSPIYHIIKAKILKKNDNLDEALKTLVTAMNIPGVKKAAPAGAKVNYNVTSSNRVAVYLELADLQRLLGMQHEATKTIQDAMNEFSGTPEEIKVTLANADFAVLRGDIDQALTLMRQIEPEQSYYLQAREKMANVYLKHRKDKKLFISVYRELVDKKPNTESFLLLGDAYMSIQEPEKAINVYEAALKKNPRDIHLASKIGHALIKTHQYSKAISYYEAALKSGGQSFLRFDLAELHMKLKNFDKAVRILKQNLKEDDSSDDLSKLFDEAKCAYLLAQIAFVASKTNESEEIIQGFLRARDLQGRVIKRVALELPDELIAQKKLAAKICCDLGEYYSKNKDFEKSIVSYKEAISYNDSDVSPHLSLAKIYLSNNDLDMCQYQLVSILKNDKNNNNAILMLADLMFRKNEYDAATFHYQQLLEYNKCNYDALSKLIELHRRTGKISETEKFFIQAKRSNPRATFEAGYNFCRGLFEWYCNNASAALQSFNLARKDIVWGERSLYSMVEICINPDSELLGGETFESVDNGAKQTEKVDSDQMALKTAEKLLSEIKSQESLKFKVLQNKTLIATKDNRIVQKALFNLTEIVEANKDCVPALLAMSTCFMLLKQSPKARNQLKRLAKMTWNPEEAEDFEKVWLSLADIYIQSAKYDMALELLKKCLTSNESCAKAWEYCGFIMEKEQNYREASIKYEKAWKYSNESNPAIGYRLAFNYLKSQRYVDAINICNQVLDKYSNYPKIKKDILDKARSLVRS
ncbi:tetratricopeptide repeat protein 21B isoform X1 [Hydra vulgaris]|uniref:tetratricopeptide repeat protein 21B isoform X1 n=1 Tax=Hydra vulgaris TaxID=6087 RepID=UPI001F5F2EBA|nr:tetratricopeptide repeat protein 21B [Hydra vulgaris]